MLAVRMITALAGLPFLLGAAWLGGAVLLLLIAVLALLAADEVCRLVEDDRPHRGLVYVGVLAVMMTAYLLGEGFPGPLPAGLFLFYLLVMVIKFPNFTVHSLLVTIMAVVYPSLLVYLFLLRGLPDGLAMILFTFMVTWAFDTFGYFIGLALGRRRITPQLSPKKSLEGLLGGLLGSVLVAYAFYVLAGMGPVEQLLLLGLLVGVFAQLGDLAASAFKRFAAVKDTGRLLPGHGGILDRFDSMLFTAPLVYYLVGVLGVTA